METNEQVHSGDVRAMLFEQDSADTVWLGIRGGLERLVLRRNRRWTFKPSALFRANDSGLAATMVTALALRKIEGRRELWVGSLAGLSCLQLA